ncbi:MAG: DNA helicase RecQ, partial [bacterium]
MKVVIVAKTRMGSGACVGALTFEGRSLRLIAPDRDSNPTFNMEYEIGDVWDIDAQEPPHVDPPHVENVIVHDKRRLPPIDDVASFAQRQMSPVAGGPDALFEGLAQVAASGALYISEEGGVPSFSTMFWQPDRPLQRVEDAKRIRYRYDTEDGACTLTFVGFQEPIPEIPAGSLLRVSLAHWWRPDDLPQGELRCYVQLSGWFAPDNGSPGDEWQGSVTFDDGLPLGANPPGGLPPLPEAPPFASLREDDTALIREAQQMDPAAALKTVFGFDDFRPLQEQVIDNVLDKRDTLAVMPTGSGKSLCFQLPALLFPGLTVVVSPLISLMEDQVMQLREMGVAAAYLNSTLDYDSYLGVVERVRRGRVRLLYAAPETLLRPETLVLLEQVPVDCLTIDEAHCISEWGHDFRPEYRQLTDLRRRLPDAVCLAITATATEHVRQDIKDSLDIPDAQAYVASFNRENLFLEVAQKTDVLGQTLAFLRERRGQAGIIYCTTRKQVDVLTEQLRANGYAALPYHAGLPDHTRRRHQRQFMHDNADIIVATVAFGMGINKSNVRFILHVDLPKNLESYYQQIGRAGRDGLPADCLLLYSYSDVHTINYFIREQDPAQQPGAQARLEAMIGFAEAKLCRRQPLLNYFGEAYDEENCDNCDNCTREQQELADLTEPAQKFLSCVKRTGEIYGASHIINVLRGSKAKRVLSRGHDKLTTYNIGREFSTKQWKQLARQFIQMGLLTQDMTHGSLKLTKKGYGVFRGETVKGVLPQKEQRAPRRERRAESAVDGEHDAELFELLRARRRALAEEAGLPPYTVFQDRT